MTFVAPRTPRVLLLCDRLDVAGGVERFVCTLASHLVTQGLDVAVGSVGTARAQLRYPLHPAVRVVHGAQRLPEPAAGGTGRAVAAWALLHKQWRTGRVLARLVRAEAPDAVLLNGLTTACSTLLFMPRRDVARTVCCDHNHFGARSWPWRWLRDWLYRRAAAIVSLTQADAARFAAINPCTEVIHNASSLHAAAPAAAVAADAPVALGVARHVAQKGLDLLLQAWALVLPSLPGAQLRIAGDGPLQAALQAQAQQLGIAASVQWLPPTSDMRAVYRSAALFVLPSRYEGMPLALLEAQALGLPAVAFDCPTGPADILSIDTGVLVPAGDVPALAQALLALLRDAPLRARMGAAAIRRSQALFSPAQHHQRWAALLLRVAQRSVHDTAPAAPKARRA